jgi:hypothetical protein
MTRFYLRFSYFFLLAAVLFTACQKDESVKNTMPESSAAIADSALQVTAVSTPGNYLASKGTLTVKLPDSTYTFNAEQDSIAFVNITIDSVQYYGITAINKAHTVSFGISSSGEPIDELSSYVSGCQVLLKRPEKSDLEYTLIRSAHQQNFGSIYIEKYNQDVTLAKGTFHTFVSADTAANAPYYTAKGSFELKIQ